MKKLLILFILMMQTLALFAAFDIFSDTAEENSQRSISLTTETGVRMYRDKQLVPVLNFGVSATQETAKFKVQADLNYDVQNQTLSSDQLTITMFQGPTNLYAGWTTHPWGSASLSHVVDVVNAQDISAGIIDDLEAMKRREFLLGFTTYWEKSSLDVVVKPGFLPNSMASDGRWSLIPAAFASVTLTEPDTQTLQNSGGGARYRLHMGNMDLGLIYFNGYWPQSGYTNITYDSSFAVTGADLVYTRYQLFGLESNVLLGPFSLALEGGYFLSEDLDGTDSGLYNSKAAYLAELSYTDTATSAFFAVAYQGQYVFDYPANPIDVDVMAAYNNKAYANTIIAVVEVPLFRQLVNARIAGTYQIESEGYLVMGSLSYALQDNVSLVGKAFLYGSLSSLSSIYDTWDANDSVQIALQAWF